MNMKKIYKAIAKKHGVTAAEVKRDMQTAIDETYKTASSHALRVHREEDKPTPEELIAHVARRVKSKG